MTNNVLSLKKKVIQEEGGIKYIHKSEKADKGGRGVGEMLTMADKEGRGGLDPPFLADIICEKPLTTTKYTKALPLQTRFQSSLMDYILSINT